MTKTIPHIIYNGDQKPENPIAASIGFFDGVHAGHQYLAEQIKETAKEKNLSSAIITFSTHPRKVLNSTYQPALLCGLDEKLELLAKTGVDYIIVLDFSVEMSNMTAFEFLEKTLKNELNVKSLVVGYDHRFGKDRAEGFDEYKKYGDELGISIVQAKEYTPHQHISSSRIRSLIRNGEIKEASKLLTYNYTISGKIVEGFKVGRTIGFPTANIQVWERFKVIPALGVYAVYVHIEDDTYKGMLYIGNRPTLQNGSDISIEANIFDFDGNLYNKSLTVEFIDFVRHDRKFETIGELKESIRNDKEIILKLLTDIE